jgi:hypothetical protein
MPKKRRKNDPRQTITRCSKCDRELPEPKPSPAYCARCELVNDLVTERYQISPRYRPDKG